MCLVVPWAIMPKNPRISSIRCEGLNGVLITPSMGFDGKRLQILVCLLQTLSSLWLSFQVANPLLFWRVESPSMLASWYQIQRLRSILQLSWICCNAVSGSAKAWTLKPACPKILLVTVKVSISSSTISIVALSSFFLYYPLLQLVENLTWHASI